MKYSNEGFFLIFNLGAYIACICRGQIPVPFGFWMPPDPEKEKCWLGQDRVEATVITHYPTASDANNTASQPYLPRENPCHEADFTRDAC